MSFSNPFPFFPNWITSVLGNIVSQYAVHGELSVLTGLPEERRRRLMALSLRVLDVSIFSHPGQ